HSERRPPHPHRGLDDLPALSDHYCRCRRCLCRGFRHQVVIFSSKQGLIMSDFDLVLSGTVVLPDLIVEKGYGAARDGKIVHVGEGTAPSAHTRHDLGNALILPGAIDAQTHSLSQKNQEDFIWSTRSAAAGGVTTIVDMPYDEGNLVCSAEAVREKGAHAGEQARVDFALYGTIDPEEGTKRIAEQAAAGAAPFKFSTFG